MAETNSTKAGAAPAPLDPQTTDSRHHHGSLEDIEITGSALALTNRGVDIGGKFPGPRTYDERVSVLGSDGHQWAVWGEEWCCMKATRPRTEDERIRWTDHQNSKLVSGYFSIDRQAMCKDIARELCQVASFLPDEPLSRASRRAIKKKLTVLAEVQMALNHPDVDMDGLRRQLAHVGLVSRQQPYSD